MDESDEKYPDDHEVFSGHWSLRLSHFFLKRDDEKVAEMEGFLAIVFGICNDFRAQKKTLIDPITWIARSFLSCFFLFFQNISFCLF